MWSGQVTYSFISFDVKMLPFRVDDWDLVIENNGGSVDEWLTKLEEMAKYQPQ